MNDRQREKEECAIADRRAQCGLLPDDEGMITFPVSPVRLGDWYMPQGGPVSSSIRVVKLEEKGLRARRCHLSCNGEEFFLAWEMWNKSKWVLVPEGTQLAFL